MDYSQRIDLVAWQLRAYDRAADDPAQFRDESGIWVPRFLRPPAMRASRRRARHSLEALGALLGDGVKLHEHRLCAVLAAVLYGSDHMLWPFYEERAALLAGERVRDDQKTALVAQLMGRRSARASGGCEAGTVRCLEYLIRFSRIACQVLHGRLHPDIYARIRGDDGRRFAPHRDCGACLGLVAGSVFDAMREHEDEERRHEAGHIRDAWAQGPYTADRYGQLDAPLANKAVVLYDFPLCRIENGKRCEYEDEPLRAYLELLERSRAGTGAGAAGRDGLVYATCHYQQARCMSQASGGDAPTVQMRVDLRGGADRLGERYEFVQVGPPEGLGADRDWPDVWELRLKRDAAVTVSLGGCRVDDDLAPETWQRPWALARESRADDWEQAPAYCPLPLPDYMPLPLLSRFIEWTRAYSHDETAALHVDFDGQLDAGLGARESLTMPTGSGGERYMKYLASRVTNVGVCSGFDRVTFRAAHGGTPGAEALVASLRTLLAHGDAGFELLLRYVEQYMRSHDVAEPNAAFVNEDGYSAGLAKPWLLERTQRHRVGDRRPVYAIGIDIGATSCKFALYEADPARWRADVTPIATHRIGTQKIPGDNEARYQSLDEFAQALYAGIRALLARTRTSAGAVECRDVQCIGVTWPGAVRANKVAGASGILKYFSDKVASNWIRHNNLDQIRRLDLVARLRALLPDDAQERIVVTMVNDGHAEAIGRLLRADGISCRQSRWGILKLGTGTAGAVLEEGLVRPGLVEFGKLVLNVWPPTRHPGGDATPGGLLNEYCSSKLLPMLFRRAAGLSDADLPGLDSYEVARLGQFVLTAAAANGQTDLDALAADIGRFRVHRDSLEHLISRDELRLLCLKDREAVVRSAEPVLDALELDDMDALKSRCEKEGRRRLTRLLRPLLKDCADLDHGEAMALYGSAEDPFEALRCKSALNRLRRTLLTKVCDPAGSLIADCVVVIRDMYRLDGVVLGGGVLSGAETPHFAGRILRSLELHLERKYLLRLGDSEVYACDLKGRAIRKKAYTTLYSNIARNGTMLSLCDGDRAEVGALYHAMLCQNSTAIDEIDERVAVVDGGAKLTGWYRHPGPDEYEAIVLVALIRDGACLALQEPCSPAAPGDDPQAGATKTVLVAGNLRPARDKSSAAPDAEEWPTEAYLKQMAGEKLRDRVGVRVGPEHMECIPIDAKDEQARLRFWLVRADWSGDPRDVLPDQSYLGDPQWISLADACKADLPDEVRIALEAVAKRGTADPA